MNKYNVSVWSSYGKGANVDLEVDVFFNTLDEALDYLKEQWYIDEDTEFERGSYANLKAGNSCTEGNYGADWDDPTAFEYLITETSFDKEYKQLRTKHEEEVQKLKEKWSVE